MTAIGRIHGQRTSRFFPPSRDWKLPEYSDRTYFGPDGEVQLDASQGDSPEQVCRGAASHKLKPFGSRPQVKPIDVEGHKGCIVWGSDDQGAPYYAELVVPFSHQVEIKSDYFMWGTKSPSGPSLAVRHETRNSGDRSWLLSWRS